LNSSPYPWLLLNLFVGKIEHIDVLYPFSDYFFVAWEIVTMRFRRFIWLALVRATSKRWQYFYSKFLRDLEWENICENKKNLDDPVVEHIGDSLSRTTVFQFPDFSLHPPPFLLCIHPMEKLTKMGKYLRGCINGR